MLKKLCKTRKKWECNQLTFRWLSELPFASVSKRVHVQKWVLFAWTWACSGNTFSGMVLHEDPFWQRQRTTRKRPIQVSDWWFERISLSYSPGGLTGGNGPEIALWQCHSVKWNDCSVAPRLSFLSLRFCARFFSVYRAFSFPSDPKLMPSWDVSWQ